MHPITQGKDFIKVAFSTAPAGRLLPQRGKHLIPLVNLSYPFRLRSEFKIDGTLSIHYKTSSRKELRHKCPPDIRDALSELNTDF
jgi:hypothetical protein